MRFILPVGIAVLALAGCVQLAPPTTVSSQPAPAPAPSQPPVTTAPAESSTRTAATDVINREMAKRLPGRNVGPYSDCVLNNASTAELADIARLGANNSSAASASVASVVARPATTQCIAKLAAVA